MHTRKLQKVGKRSFAVSLPKEWVIANKLKEQDNVFVEKTNRNTLLISPSKKSFEKKESLEINLNEISNIQEFLVFAYLKNINHLIIKTTEFDLNTIREIKYIIRHLEGYDITYEDDSKIEISFLFNEINTNIPKIIQRMKYLLKIMYISLKDKDDETLNETENTIDRLYHLSEKILVGCINNNELRKQNSILFDEDIFFYLGIIKKLENIADGILRASKGPLMEIEINIIEDHVNFLNKVLVEKPNYKNFRPIFEEIDPMKQDIELKNLLIRIHDLTHDVIENIISIELNKKYYLNDKYTDE